METIRLQGSRRFSPRTLQQRPLPGERMPPALETHRHRRVLLDLATWEPFGLLARAAYSATWRWKMGSEVRGEVREGGRSKKVFVA